MRNSKILKVAICTALVASIGATAAITASAAVDLPSKNVGVCGVFTGNWGGDGTKDIVMNDDDGDGVWTADVDLESVKAEWITDWNKDDNPTGEKHIQFKVRLDNNWDNNWATYEPVHDRVFDSQCNLAILEDVAEGDHIKFTVFLDTNQNNPDAVAANKADPDSGVGDEVDYEFLYAGYKNFEKVTGDAAAPAEEAPAEEAPAEEAPAEEAPAAEAPAEEAPAAEAPAAEAPAAEAPSANTTGTETTTTTPATGDTTSAIALVAVVLASLGTAVVMTKKASAKD